MIIKIYEILEYVEKPQDIEFEARNLLESEF